MLREAKYKYEKHTSLAFFLRRFGFGHSPGVRPLLGLVRFFEIYMLLLGVSLALDILWYWCLG